MKKTKYKLQMTLQQYILRNHDNWSIIEDFGIDLPETWP
jgi:hypothetical protein